MQDDVLERAKKAKEKAAREAMEAQGLVSKSSVETKFTDNGASTTSSYSVQSSSPSETTREPDKQEQPTLSSSNDD